jgi:hypothetical protein
VAKDFSDGPLVSRVADSLRIRIVESRGQTAERRLENSNESTIRDTSCATRSDRTERCRTPTWSLRAATAPCVCGRLDAPVRLIPGSDRRS